jgi:hypothetical protein
MSRRPLGYILGRVHYYRDRGASYVDGFRTSLQAGVLMAGVAFGANFTQRTEAIWLGIGVALGLEILKIIMGRIDLRMEIMHSQRTAEMEVNPPQRWQLELLEEIALRLGTAPTWIHGKREEMGLNNGAQTLRDRQRFAGK